MILTNYHYKILRYINRKGTVSYQVLEKKHLGNREILFKLIHNEYIIQHGGSCNEYGDPIPFQNDTLFSLSDAGIASAESKQWFSTQFILLQIVLPIVIAIITTLLTIFLTAWLSPSL